MASSGRRSGSTFVRDGSDILGELPRHMATLIEVPKRAFFTSAEVCTIAGVQPYVLKSWEKEFPSLGGKLRKDGSSVYGRAEVELVLEIKHLVYGDGLTLGAARRKLRVEQEANELEPELLHGRLDDEIRERFTAVKQGLREILELLSGNGVGAVQEPLQLDQAGSEAKIAPRAKAQAKSVGTTRGSSSRGRGDKGRATANRKHRTA